MTSLFNLRGAALALACTALTACSTTGATSGFGPISNADEYPIILPVTQGPPTEADLAFHEAAIERCASVVTEMRGTPLQAGAQRGTIIGVTAFGASSAEPLMQPLAPFQGLYAGAYGGVQWAMVYRDGLANLVFTCARDATVEGLVWYSPAEIRDPARRAQLERAAAQVRAQVPPQSPPPPTGQSGEQRRYWPSATSRSGG